MAKTIIEAEVTVTKVWPPKGKFFAFNCAELVTDENKYGRVSAPVAIYKKIKENGVYQIAYHVTEEGYLNFDTLITDLAKSDPRPKNVRPATNPVDSDRMGTMGMVNGVLNGWAQGRPLDEILQVLQNSKGKIAKIIDHLNDELHMTKMHGAETQRADDLNDQIPFP